jgi:catechol 2,3-dioxygenase-like lactoylglutathione lyase family enzyme
MSPSCVHHISLTVTDLDASVAWYERVFDIHPLMDEPHDGGMARILADEQWRLVIGLHRHDVNQGEQFSERRTGLDHVGFAVPSRNEMEVWQQHFRDLGVQQSPIADRPYGSVLVFRDPDNIQLELFAPPSN